MKHVKEYIKSNFYNHFIVGFGLGLLVTGISYGIGIFIILGFVAFLVGCLAINIQDGDNEQ